MGINSMVGLRGTGIAGWKPMVWEITSIIVIFALIPLVVRFEAHFRLDGHPRWRIALRTRRRADIFGTACRGHAAASKVGLRRCRPTIWL